ncbi:MAG: phosphate ABC transporter substrate-binding/OmpA family protein [Candidatus Poribacteria bacterium]|nr:phosphate ABC transporter substrate-binding/OmpA family protein [Candidatus Poribacteria bacterium]
MMNNASSSKKALSKIIMIFCWLVILGIAGAIYKFVIEPRMKEKTVVTTSTPSRYTHEIKIAHDSFSGYAILRSPSVQNLLNRQEIKLTFVDDKADYVRRIKNLRSGKVQMAVFTIDAYIKAGDAIGEFPGSIVLVIDETKGADAILAYKQGVSQISKLSNPNAKIVLTPDSPSETLARVMINKMSLPSLPQDWAIAADGAEDVYKKLKAGNPNDPRAYVLWEPYVTKALAIDGVHVLLDSSKLKGYIVDVLIAQRQFLNEQPTLVEAVVQAYLRARYDYANQPDGLMDLVLEDAKRYGDSLKRSESENLVNGIEWRNTMENYAHFGIISGQEAKDTDHLEDMIAKIIRVLVQTDAISGDALAGDYGQIFYDGILRSLRHDKFHPSVAASSGLDEIVLEDLAATVLPEVTDAKVLSNLSDSEWSRLVPVGTMKFDPIQFGRGNARIHRNSQRALARLTEDLDSFPQWYLKILGHTRREGDAEANRILAQQRAEVVAAFLMSKGINPHRIKFIASDQPPDNAAGGKAQSVTFVLLEKPY